MHVSLLRSPKFSDSCLRGGVNDFSLPLFSLRARDRPRVRDAGGDIKDIVGTGVVVEEASSAAMR